MTTKTKGKTKLLRLSLVTDVNDKELDSLKGAAACADHPYRRSMDVLMQAQRDWDNMREFRKERERCKRYNYGDQWGDIIEFKDKWGRKRRMTEEQYIREQGSEPLKNNLIRRLVKNYLGVYRSQSKEPTCVARDRDEQRYGETMSVILQYNRQQNCCSGLDARAFEEFLISGAAIQRKKFGWRKGKQDEWTYNVRPDCFFIGNNMQDFRGWDVTRLGMVHDMEFGQLLNQFAKSPQDVKRLKEIYSTQSYMRRVTENMQRFGIYEAKNVDFFQPGNPTLCRVIEVWRQEFKPRYYCHDFNNGDYYKIDVEDYDELVVQENKRRIAEGVELGMAENDIPLIKAEWKEDNYWYCYYLSPFGDILEEFETPYAHGEHPFVFKFYPFIDGEIHSFVADLIDQQRYVNRLITMYDWIMRASAKGVLLCPDDMLPDDMTWDDVADEWSRYNGIVRYKVGKGKQVPQQVAANSVNIGIGDLLNFQLKFMEDISGVNGALQGKAGASASGSLFAQQTQNATMSLLDLLETFSEFIVEGAYKDVKNMQQFYDTKMTRNIVGRAGQVVDYDPKKIRDVDFDLSISESTSTQAYRQMANDFLMEIWRSGQITLEQMLQVGEFPFGDELMQSIKSNGQAMQQGGEAQPLSPELQQQIAEQTSTNPQAQAILRQMMSGRGVPPSEQVA